MVRRKFQPLIVSCLAAMAMGPVPACHDIEPFPLSGDHDMAAAGFAGAQSEAQGDADAGADSEPSRPCKPDEVRCVDTERFKVCGADGRWKAPEACPLACSGNACVGSCVADDTRCDTSRELSTCTPEGSWSTSTCMAACLDGQCTGTCVPDTRRCLDEDDQPSEEGVQTQVCDYTGQWSGTVDCLEGCRAATCHGQCDENAPDLCVLDGSTHKALQCSAGTWQKVDCPYICEAGACVGSCKPGSARCDAEGRPETCNQSAKWERNSCAAGQVCVKDGSCLAPPAVITFTSDHSIARAGTAVFFQWTLGGGPAERISIVPEVGRDIDASERSVTFVPERSGKYMLQVENAAGSGSRSLEVNLSPTGQLDRLHRYGAAGHAVALALSPSGRVVSIVKSAGSYTVGPISVVDDDVYLAEHDLETNSVLRIQIPEIVRNGHDLVFDSEDLLVTGDARGLDVPRTDPQAIAVARLDANLQMVDSHVYSEDNGDWGVRILLGREREVYVLGYSSVTVSSSLVELDPDLNPILDDPAFHYTTQPGRAWIDATIDSSMTLVGLRPLPTPAAELFFRNTPDTVVPVDWTFDDTAGGVNAIATHAAGTFIIVGWVGQQGYLQPLLPPARLIWGQTNYYPPDPQSSEYDSLVFNDVCVDSAGRILVVGDVVIDGQSDIFVHAFSINDFAEEWEAPLIWGAPEVNEWGVRIVCDPRGYALVLGKEMRPSGETGPLILRVR